MSVTAYTKTGAKSTDSVKLDSSIFGVKTDDYQLLKQVYVAEQANARTTVARTKTRGEVRGGGRKPWRQKGTGRARFGSIRNPIWRGGGIVFGPRAVENYSKKVNHASKLTAIKQALSLKAANAKQGGLLYIEDLPASGKTKDVAALINKIGFKRGVIVSGLVSDELKRSVANLPEVKIINASKLSTADVLNSEQLLVTKSGLEALNSRLSGKKA